MIETSDAANRSIVQFFVLAFALIVPFWVLGTATGLQVLPGLPVAGFAFVCPAAAAMILVYRDSRFAGGAALLKRSLELKSKIWLGPTLLLMPVVMVLSFAVLRVSSQPVPAPQIALLPAVGLCAAFFVGALGEELGWSGYAIDPMQARWGALRASIVLGLIWAVYHYLGLAQANRSIAWVAWWSVGTVASRVIITWLYNNSGKSVLAAPLFHMTINVTWQLFPVNGSYYDPSVTGLILAAVAAIVVVGWGARALTGYRQPSTA